MEISTITTTVSKNSAAEVLFHLKTQKCILKDCSGKNEFSKIPEWK